MKRLLSHLAITALLILSITKPVPAEDWSRIFRDTVKKHLVDVALKHPTKGEGTCTGIVVGYGEVLTAKHCFFPPVDKSPVELVDTPATAVVQKRPATLKLIAENIDLVLLDADTRGKSPIFMPYKSPDPGTPVAAIGHAAGDDNYSISPMFVLGYEKGFLNTNHIIFPGYSGGALVDFKGHLAGVMVWTNPTWSYSGIVPMAQVQRFLEKEGAPAVFGAENP